MLNALAELKGYDFWPDSMDYRALETRSIQGHRQVTDAYLVGLAVSHGAKLATLDIALAATWPSHTELVSAP